MTNAPHELNACQSCGIQGSGSRGQIQRLFLAIYEGGKAEGEGEGGGQLSVVSCQLSVVVWELAGGWVAGNWGLTGFVHDGPEFVP